MKYIAFLFIIFLTTSCAHLNTNRDTNLSKVISYKYLEVDYSLGNGYKEHYQCGYEYARKRDCCYSDEHRDLMYLFLAGGKEYLDKNLNTGVYDKYDFAATYEGINDAYMDKPSKFERVETIDCIF